MLLGYLSSNVNSVPVKLVEGVKLAVVCAPVTSATGIAATEERVVPSPLVMYLLAKEVAPVPPLLTGSVDRTDKVPVPPEVVTIPLLVKFDKVEIL